MKLPPKTRIGNPLEALERRFSLAASGYDHRPQLWGGLPTVPRTETEKHKDSQLSVLPHVQTNSKYAVFAIEVPEVFLDLAKARSGLALA